MEQREVIVLKIWHRCTFEEIGGLLEISPNTAAGRYRYGLQKIKSNWKEWFMKEMNLLETQLRSWRPRRPSAGLKRRLFSARPGARRERGLALGWLAPATACLLLTLAVFNSGNDFPPFPAPRTADHHDFEQPELRRVCLGRLPECGKPSGQRHF